MASLRKYAVRTGHGPYGAADSAARTKTYRDAATAARAGEQDPEAMTDDYARRRARLDALLGGAPAPKTASAKQWWRAHENVAHPTNSQQVGSRGSAAESKRLS